uniref:C2H2-type domain-containing protein n=1 Tax=viral metagenome TaxID=1070528 RepID=A0A6C0C4S4_9ZZZZ
MACQKISCKKSIFICEKCTFKCSNKYNYNKHLLTKKHKILTNTDTNTYNIDVKHVKNIFMCECGKEYKHRQSLHNHKKICDYEKNNEIKINKKEEEDYKELLHSVIKQNTELQKTITNLIPKIGNTTNSHNNINQKFNINVFLNEECKDALTMEQFIDKIEVSMGNLLLTKNKGIDEGISNIFIENMSKLSLYERPMHCTDSKRDIIYIKSDADNGDDAQWEKDTDKEKIKRAIKRIESKQHKNLGIWMEEHPGWEDDAALKEEYLELMRSCTTDVKDQKIIKKVCNTVKID